MSEVDTLLVLGASYDDREAAEADYEAVKALYHEVEVTHAFDAAVLERDAEGKVHVVRKHEHPTRHGVANGLGWGLAIAANIKAVNRYVSAEIDASADQLAEAIKAAEGAES